MRHNHTGSSDPSHQETKTANVGQGERPVLLNETPPYADIAFRIPQKFSVFSPGLPPTGPVQRTSPRSEDRSPCTDDDVVRFESDVHITKYGCVPWRRVGTTQTKRDQSEQKQNQANCFTLSHCQPFIIAPAVSGDCVEKFTRPKRNEEEPFCATRDAYIHWTSFAARVGTELNPRGKEFSTHGVIDVGVERMSKLKSGSQDRLKNNYRGRSPSKSQPMRFLLYRSHKSTPSERLLAALPFRTRQVLAPPGWTKADLSHVAIRQWENVRRGRRGRRLVKGPCVANQIPESQLSRRSKRRISLCAILFRYMTERFTSEERARSKLHEKETREYLHLKGYSAEDVVSWNHILLSSDADRMVSEMVARDNAISSSYGQPLPTFLLMLILRARSLKATSLRLLLTYISKNLVGQLPGPEAQTTPRTTSEQTAMTLVVRLLRHARLVWPHGLEEIAVIATKLIDRKVEGTVNLSRQHIQLFSHLYNRLLTLFAKTTSLDPFLSVAIQQRSQFCLIRKMTKFKPHLPVTREGFRALTNVQLAHKKTEEERIWALSKALSWPPWKEELLGIEAGSEDSGRKSRAVEVLSRMTEAGYSHLPLEQIGRIFAGWDTDGSPTIQTRTFLSQGPLVQSGDVAAKGKNSDYWATRILATRTIKEAWGCFTSYEKSSSEHHNMAPYNAMFARLLHAKETYSDPNEEISTMLVVPGDGKETWPEPTSPHDFLYVPSNPPSVKELFEMMIGRGLKLGVYLLTELLDKAETLAEGVKYINAGRLSQPERHALLGNSQQDADHLRATMEAVDDRLLAAFVGLLCRAEATVEISFALPNISNPSGVVSRGVLTTDPFLYAQSLVSAIQPSYRPTWYALFHGLDRRIIKAQPQGLQRLWVSLIDRLQEMDALGIDLDFGVFIDIGRILENFLVASRDIITLRVDELPSDPKLRCVSICKSVFNAMAYGGPIKSKEAFAQSTTWLPLGLSSQTHDRVHLIDIPRPAILHRTIRILGMGQDSESILHLLRWMHCVAPELASVANEIANSNRMTRSAMIAVRYFIEKSWQDEDFNHRAALRGEWEPGQEELLLEAKTIIEQHPDDWGGWAKDEELYLYHDMNRKKGKRLRESVGMR